MVADDHRHRGGVAPLAEEMIMNVMRVLDQFHHVPLRMRMFRRMEMTGKPTTTQKTTKKYIMTRMAMN